MRINSSTIGMESARRYSSSTTRTTGFKVKDYKNAATHQSDEKSDSLVNTSKEENQNPIEAMKELNRKTGAVRNHIRSGSQGSMDAFRQYTIRSILSLLLGLKGETVQDLKEGISGSNEFTLQEPQMNMVSLRSETFFQESEYTSFSTTGKVTTQDGREISINLDIAMSRQFTQVFSREIEIMQVNTCDPLVLNFQGNAAQLSDQKFFFDLDADGEKEEISLLNSQSGYLALDRNKDHIINDGSELFGTKTGNGFSELAKLDEDGNGWIDENDTAFYKLKIWCQNPDGSATLYSLADKGIGAICLENADTEFSLKNEDNQTNGIIRRTGIFLFEDGNVGTVQHLDIAN